jgi:hypothetical protein
MLGDDKITPTDALKAARIAYTYKVHILSMPGSSITTKCLALSRHSFMGLQGIATGSRMWLQELSVPTSVPQYRVLPQRADQSSRLTQLPTHTDIGEEEEWLKTKLSLGLCPFTLRF